jgi:cobalamin biosynthesis Mg chelatase CobN
MLEAVRREYWAPDDAIVQDLVARQQELNPQGAGGRLGEFIDGLSAGFGLDSPAMDASSVSGQRLTQVDMENPQQQSPQNLPLLLLALLLIIAAGSARQWLAGSHVFNHVRSRV